MFKRLKGIEQEIPRGLLNIFLIEYQFKAERNRLGDERGLLSRLLIKNVLKALGNRPLNLKGTFSYIFHSILLP